MEIEGQIEERRLTRTSRVDEAYLVERRIGLVAANGIRSVSLRHQTERHVDIRLAEQTDTGRIGRYRRDISTQRLHSASHSHIAGGTVQVLLSNLHILVCLLGCHRHCAYNQSSHHQ